MWNNNLTVQYVYATYGTQAVWAIFSGIAGWKLIKKGSADAVANIAELLSTAKTHGRKVNAHAWLRWTPARLLEPSSI